MALEDGESFLSFRLRKTQNYHFKKRPDENIKDINDISQNLIKKETIGASLDIVYYEKGEQKLYLENFIKFNPKFCEGVLERASYELLKGEQNIGKIGLLLPLHRIGCFSPDWAVLDFNDRAVYSLAEGGFNKEPIKLPLYSECGGTIYKGERNSVILSPSYNVFATLSKKGKLCLFQDEKELFQEENVFCFCFHPIKKILYYGSQNGLHFYDFEKMASTKINNSVFRLIRISKNGSFLFSILAGGEKAIKIYKIGASGENIEKEIFLDDETKKSDDWVFSSDSILVSVSNKNENAFIVETDLKNNKARRIESPKNCELFIINCNAYPTIIAKSLNGANKNNILYFYNIYKGSFEKLVAQN
ncbi:MAG: hypothetical protein N2445_03355 [Acidobacteria bacterium]|nr:hypothetical protein [Acidobacteriota bacterium]